MARYLLLVLLVLAIVACGGPAAPTPDAVATQVAQAQAVAATLTALAPTATSTPIPTETPTPTPVPSPTPIPTKTPVPLFEGSPVSYIPTEAEMPGGFVVNPYVSKAAIDTAYPVAALGYGRDILEVVGYIVVVAPDEASAKTTFRGISGVPSGAAVANVAVAGVDEYSSYRTPDPAVIYTFLRKRNVVAAVFSGGIGQFGAEYWVGLLTNKLRP